MKTIQAKFVIIILSGVLLSAILIGSVAVFSFQEVTGKDSKKIMNLTCEKNASELNGVLKGIEQSVKIMEVYARTIFDEKKLEDNNDYREKRTAELESLAKNIADNTDGAVAVYFRFAPEIAGDTSGFFWSKTKDSDTFHSVPPTDISKYDPEDVEHVGWYYIPVKNGKPTWLLPYFNKNTNSVVSFAYFDVLTGARNKNAYQEEVNRIEEQIHFGETQFAVVVFDVNNLKKTNDTYGHTVGDELIIRGYNQIRHVFKKIPVYRIGGDEFVVILENYSEEECDQYIRHFRDENRKKNSNLYKDEHPVYVASGCAMYDSRTDMTFTEVFDKADQAMYANKMDMKREQEAQHG
ncbi:MAG: diguanylate cyclase domain-containing protein [Lachnospiraceae bacterium]